MECGIVGPPLSGKSTLFNILTGIESSVSDYGKRETRRGVAQLTDPRLDKLAIVWKSRKTTHAAVEYVDVPGISSEDKRSEPYPAQYLSELRKTDMLALVIRDFDNPVVPHPAGNIDPMRDLIDATLEFIVNDLDIVERRLNRLSKIHDKNSYREADLLERCRSELTNENHLRDLDFTTDESKILKTFSFLSLKPLLVVLNLDENKAHKAEVHISKLKEEIDSLKHRVGWVAIAAGIEAEIAQLDEEERSPFMEELGLVLPALDRVIHATFDLLGLITFLTAAEKEAHAWSIPAGSTALKAAGTIHNDMARGFIRAEVCNWKEIVEAGTEVQLKKEGKLRLEGKNYIVQDGDVLMIRFNV